MHETIVREFDGVTDEIKQHLPYARRITGDIGGHIRVDFIVQTQPFFLSARFHQGHYTGQKTVKVEPNILEIELSRFHLGKIQNVVQNRQKGFSRIFDRIQVVGLKRIQFRVLDQGYDPEYPVQRGTHLVAHRREKNRFGGSGCLCFLFGQF